MPEIADPPSVCCFLLHSESDTEELQQLGPDLFRARAPAREATPGMGDKSGRFAKGHSGNPKGRPRGIPNPKRRVLTLAGWRRNPQAAELVKLRFFVGLNYEEAAQALGISERSAKRYWTFARAWLYRELSQRRAG